MVASIPHPHGLDLSANTKFVVADIDAYEFGFHDNRYRAHDFVRRCLDNLAGCMGSGTLADRDRR